MVQGEMAASKYQTLSPANQPANENPATVFGTGSQFPPEVRGVVPTLSAVSAVGCAQGGLRPASPRKEGRRVRPGG